MASELTKLKCPASSPANEEEKKTKGDECQFYSKSAADHTPKCHKRYSIVQKLSNQQSAKVMCRLIDLEQHTEKVKKAI